jgi:hypothetical protein
MNKTEARLSDALRLNKPFSGGNTVYNPTTGTVTLYSTAIAQREGSGWKFNLGGYNTATTRSRLNAVAQTFGLLPVRTVKGTPMCGTDAVPTDGWFYP